MDRREQESAGLESFVHAVGSPSADPKWLPRRKDSLPGDAAGAADRSLHMDFAYMDQRERMLAWLSKKLGYLAF